MIICGLGTAFGEETWTTVFPVPAGCFGVFFFRAITSRAMALEAANNPFPSGIITRPIFRDSERLFPFDRGFATGDATGARLDFTFWTNTRGLSAGAVPSPAIGDFPAGPFRGFGEGVGCGPLALDFRAA